MRHDRVGTGLRPDRETVAFVLLAALAATSYLWRLTWSDIWIDEAFSRALTRHSLSELVRLVAHDSHPPLYFLALKAFTAVAGASDYAIRLFSALGALATLILGFFVGRRVFGGAGALLWCALLVALPMPGLYAHVARMYTWAAFLGVGVYLHAVLFARERRRRDLVALGLFSAMAVYTHYFSLIAAFWIDAALLLHLLAKGDRAWRRVAAMGCAVFVLYLPWLLALREQAATVQRDFWIPPITWASVADCYVKPCGGFYVMYDASWPIVALLVALTLLSIPVVLASDTREDRLALGFALVGFHATIITAAAVSLWFRPVLYPRYVMTIAPLLVIPPVFVLLRMRHVVARWGVVGVMLACGLFIVFSESAFSFGPYRLALRALAREHPEVGKIVHVNEVTAGPFSEYGRGGPWAQFYLRNDGTSWYSNMEILDTVTAVPDLDAMAVPGEVVCLVEFVGLPLNGQNLDRTKARCDVIAIRDVYDDKPYAGVLLRLHILRVRPRGRP